MSETVELARSYDQAHELAEKFGIGAPAIIQRLLDARDHDTTVYSPEKTYLKVSDRVSELIDFLSTNLIAKYVTKDDLTGLLRSVIDSIEEDQSQGINPKQVLIRKDGKYNTEGNIPIVGSNFQIVIEKNNYGSQEVVVWICEDPYPDLL